MRIILFDSPHFPKPWQSLERGTRCWMLEQVTYRKPPAFQTWGPAEKILAGECLSLEHSSQTELLVVEIDWVQFTDTQIRLSFTKWLRKNRPRDVAPPSGRGRKLNDRRVALDNLGVMRAMNAYKTSDLPNDVAKFGRKCWDKRTAALKEFRRMFPFLPATEKPLHWLTEPRVKHQVPPLNRRSFAG